MPIRVPISRPVISKEDVDFVAKTLGEGQISGRAPVVNEFEKTFAGLVGLRHAVAVSSGTAALHVALLACEVRRADRVVQPCLTMMSTAFAASYVGGEILPVDVEEKYWCIDTSQVARLLKRRLKVKLMIAVHLYGNPACVDEMSEMGRSKGAYLIEDCAEGLGTRLKGRQVGTFGDVATFSFFSNKLITTGEGGMIVSNNEEIAERARSIRDLCFGKKNKFLHDGLGYNYRMSAMQASLGLSQLLRVDDLIRRKRMLADTYRQELEGTPRLQLHPERPNSFSLPWMYSILVEDPKGTNLRDRLILDLGNSGIETRPFFVPIHMQPVYARQMRNRRFPVSEDLSLRGLNLPSSINLSGDEIKGIAAAVKSGLRTLAP